jgi:hypothetical protein
MWSLEVHKSTCRLAAHPDLTSPFSFPSSLLLLPASLPSLQPYQCPIHGCYHLQGQGGASGAEAGREQGLLQAVHEGELGRRAVLPGVLRRRVGGVGALHVGVAAGHAQERRRLHGHPAASHAAAGLLHRQAAGHPP